MEIIVAALITAAGAIAAAWIGQPKSSRSDSSKESKRPLS